MRFLFILSEVFQNFKRNSFMTVSVILVTFVSLLFVGASSMIQMQIVKSKGDWYDKVQVAVYMCPEGETSLTCPTGDEATELDVQNVKNLVARELADDVSSIDVVSKEQNFAKFVERYPDGVFKNQVITADDMQITLLLNLNNPENYSVVADVLGGRSGIQKVVDQRELFDPIFSALNVLTIVAISLAIIMIISAILLISTTIRLSAASRRVESEIKRLVGASNLFIQLPFMLEGAISAIIGSLLAGLTLLGVDAFIINGPLAASVNWIDFLTVLEVLPVVPLLVVVAVILALISSLITVRKYTRV